MLIHILPEIVGPPDVSVRLIDLRIPEMGWRLEGAGLKTGRPYPNKQYRVGYRASRAQSRATLGLLLETESPIETYTVEAIWEIEGRRVTTHRVEHTILDQEYDAVSDLMMLWYGTDSSAGSWANRWPTPYTHPPVVLQPKMDICDAAHGGSIRAGDVTDTITPDGFVTQRIERFTVPTLERARLLGRGDWDMGLRMPIAISDVVLDY